MNATATLAGKRDALCAELGTLRDAQERLNFLVVRARQRPSLAEMEKIQANRVEGCLAKLWIAPHCNGERCFFALADDEQMVSALPMKHRFGRAFDGIGRAEPDARGFCGRDGFGREQFAEQRIVAHVGRRIPLENDRFA